MAGCWRPRHGAAQCSRHLTRTPPRGPPRNPPLLPSPRPHPPTPGPHRWMPAFRLPSWATTPTRTASLVRDGVSTPVDLQARWWREWGRVGVGRGAPPPPPGGPGGGRARPDGANAAPPNHPAHTPSHPPLPSQPTSSALNPASTSPWTPRPAPHRPTQRSCTPPTAGHTSSTSSRRAGSGVKGRMGRTGAGACVWGGSGRPAGADACLRRAGITRRTSPTPAAWWHVPGRPPPGAKQTDVGQARGPPGVWLGGRAAIHV